MDADEKRACNEVLARAHALLERGVTHIEGDDLPAREANAFEGSLATLRLLGLDARALGPRALALKEILEQLAHALLALEFPPDAPFERLVELVAEGHDVPLFVDVLGAIERTVGAPGGPLRELLVAVQQEWARDKDAEARALVARLNRLLASAPIVLPEPGFPWSQCARFDVGKLPPRERAPWYALFALGLDASGSAPSRRWLAAARKHIAAIGAATFAARASEWFARFEVPDGAIPGEHPRILPGFARNEELVRGLVWSASTVAEPGLATALGDLALVCFAKVPEVGALSARVGNACAYALSELPDGAGIAQLARLGDRVSSMPARALIAQRKNAAASRAGIGLDDLEELSVPTLGLSIEDALARADGRGPALDAKTAKDLGTLAEVQRTRLERLFARERTWAIVDARARFFDHPVVAPIARRLVWRVCEPGADMLAMWESDRWVGVDGRPLGPVDAATRIALWHPLGTNVTTTLAWRHRLATRRIAQPFAQANRRIYPLTLAERERVTSLRFAAHYLRQTPFLAACRRRRWEATPQGRGRDLSPPTRAIPGVGLTAVLSVVPTLEERTPGTALFLATEDVSFFRTGVVGPPIPLADVPPVAFSEVMHDVDELVTECSIGLNPGYDGRELEGSFSLSALAIPADALARHARSRPSAIARAIVDVDLAPRCRLDERYLVVRGDAHSYAIDLRTAAAYIEPAEEHLYFARSPPAPSEAKGAPSRVEGDPVLARIVARARILAADAEIVDESLRRQIDGTGAI